MRLSIKVALLAASVSLPLFSVRRGYGQTEQDVIHLRESFNHPPPDCRIMMRWWWFGPAVTKSEIQRELEQMKAAGIGGVEIATLYPLELDDSRAGFRNLPYLSDEYLDLLRFANWEARKLGLRVDITLGSGWPFGGPHIPVEQAAGQMRIETVAIPSKARSPAVPDLSTGEQVIATFLVPKSTNGLEYGNGKLVQNPSIPNDRLQFPIGGSEAQSAIFFISSRTGMTVKRPAIGAEGFVLDHYDGAAMATHLRAVGDRLMEAFGEQPPYAVFSDSLEDYGSNWTSGLLEEFQKRRGYDLTPHLPALIADTGAETAAVRHDWGKTLTELANEGFLAPLHAWAQLHHTRLRSQTYGFPPVTLSSNRLEDLPEGEGKATLKMWREFSDTRWAASAGHLFGKNVVSSETWTWLHSPAFRATPLDMKAEADLHFLQGINQLVGHGWPYSPESAGEPGWRMYAAGAFNAHNPWWFAMPSLTAYLQRVSFALRQGAPANDVALLLPNDDAWASFFVPQKIVAVTTKGGFNTLGENVSIDESMPRLLGTNVISQTLDAGFNLDFIDADAIDTLGVHYPVLVLAGVKRLPLTTYQKIEQYAAHGGIVVATGSLPSTAPGYLNAERETQKIQEISQRLFRQQGAAGHFVEDESQLGRTIAKYLQPDLEISPRVPEIGFIHRHLGIGDLYFLANTGNRQQQISVKFRHAARYLETWDPFTGQITPLVGSNRIAINLQPYESEVIFFTNSASETNKSRPSLRDAATTGTITDLSADWDITFANSNQSVHMTALHSWSEEEQSKYYSGQATYRKQIDLPAGITSQSLILDFGAGTPVEKPDPLPQFNLRAYLESPVREAAEVYVNGRSAGVVWHPPYQLELSPLARPGKNELRIVVGNTAMNEMAGVALPSYRLLNNRYGERFTPQDMDKIQPLPSGILAGLRLIAMPRRASAGP
jgi:hypothetical protein